MAARFEPIAQRYLDIIIDGEVEKMCRCPFCEGASSLQFNADNGLWVCFRCDSKGNSKTLVRRLGGVYSDPVVSVDNIRQTIDRMRTRDKKKAQGEKVLDETTLARFDFADDYWNHDRGFTQDTIRRWNLGYDPISDRHTIAYRNEHSDLLGVIQRLKGDVFPRYIYPEGFNRKNSLFGSWNIDSPNVALVEGSTDAIALDQDSIPAVAQYGSSISMGQVRLLHRLGIKEIVMFYDYDEAGRKAEERSREVLSGFILRTVEWDTNKYCWHKKLCACGEHTWRDIGKCQNKVMCKCGRKHEVDPGSLPSKKRKQMYRDAVLVGSKKKWPARKFA